MFYDLNYSDLFTRMWLARHRAFTKTELYRFTPKVSHRTAVKYVQTAIEKGLLDASLQTFETRRVFS